ncbi:hybrid sensor histidine kinase/response regulator [Stratiformator vulcanicus]|uniref:histidine kinase n=1 Tax=Stratiformator vulcanicus TaxID=2527980 RepID=A0A517R0J1_9PLAN|nr:ATP-binding protein [Stratiformator vulcanicus]QDT37416.1 Autoinducer 2 sensor kinase/phosphatase LuxQ [Stratiformator vulcanicus]
MTESTNQHPRILYFANRPIAQTGLQSFVDELRDEFDLVEVQVHASQDSRKFLEAFDAEITSRLKEAACDIIALDLCAFDSRWVSKIILGIADRHRSIPLLTVIPDRLHAATALDAGAVEYVACDNISHSVLRHAFYSAIARNSIGESSRLVESEVRRLIDENIDGMLVVNETGKVLFANRSAEMLLGRSHEELVGSDFGSPSADEDSCEVNIVRERGTEFETLTVEIRYSEIEWAGETAYLETLRDVTDYRQDLDDAVESTRQRDQFLSTLSHELRNPLATMSYASELLKRRMSGLDEQLTFTIETIGRQVQHMKRLLDDLLDISRVWQGKIKLETSPFDMIELLQDITRELDPRFEQKSQTLTVELPATTAPVDGDKSRLRQVFSNLLSNAAKYTPNEGSIHVSAEVAAGTILVQVRDNGDGIADDNLQSIFDPFVQLKHRTHTKESGLGIGLAVVKKLTELHGGSIVASSDGPGRGSTFRLTFPLLDPSQPLEESVAPKPRARRNDYSETVLVVEDLDALRYVTRCNVESLGYDVIEASDGEEALHQIERREPRIAIVDIGLPKLDGWEVAKRVRRSRPPEELFLIALTGYGQKHHLLQSRQSGFDVHLTKPINLEELGRVLDEAAALQTANGEDG